MALSHINSCNLLKKWYSSSSPKAFIIITAKVEEHDLKKREMKYLLVTSSMQQELAPRHYLMHLTTEQTAQIESKSSLASLELSLHTTVTINIPPSLKPSTDLVARTKKMSMGCLNWG